MKADTVSLFEFLEAKKINFLIPVYQRNYEWTKDQCIQLFKDIENIIKDSNNQKHFLGTVVYVYEPGEKQLKNYIIIDGQQRITTFMLLLKAIATVTKDNALQNEIEEDYLINSRVDGENRIKLKPVEKDRIIFNKIIEGKEILEISKVNENYKIFLELLSESSFNSYDFFTAMNRVEIVYIELNGNDESENPQIIFESINSTGLSLTASDLIRNFLLMGIDSNQQLRLYNDYWKVIEKRIPSNKISGYIRFYLHLKLGITVNEKRIYEEYKRFFKNGSYDSETAIKELEEYSRYYMDIVNETINNTQVNQIIKHINLMKATVVYPYLMAILKLQKDNYYSWTQVFGIIQIIFSYLYRRIITDKTSNALNKFFPVLAKNVTNDNELERLKNELISKKGSLVFPTDREFVLSFTTKDIYHRRNNIVKLTLTMLEHENNKEPINIETIQVEHILPQKINDEWRLDIKNVERVNEQFGDTIGNLTLTGYNQEISNKSFPNKLKYYAKSNISMTRDIAEKYAYWNKETIQDRANDLAQRALLIWNFPESNIENNDQIITGEYTLEELIDVTGLKVESATFDDKTVKLQSWTQLLTGFLNYVWEIDSLTFDMLKTKESLQRLFRDKKDIISGKQLLNGKIIETNFNANSILSIIRIIAREYEIENTISLSIK